MHAAPARSACGSVLAHAEAEAAVREGLALQQPQADDPLLRRREPGHAGADRKPDLGIDEDLVGQAAPRVLELRARGALAYGRSDRVGDVPLRHSGEPGARVDGRPAARRQEQVDEYVLREVLRQVRAAGAELEPARDRLAERAICPVDVLVGTL